MKKKVSRKKKNIRKTAIKRINMFIIALAITVTSIESFGTDNSKATVKVKQYEYSGDFLINNNVETLQRTHGLYEPPIIREVKNLIGVGEDVHTFMLAVDINKLDETVSGLNKLLLEVVMNPYDENSRVKLDAYKFITKNINMKTKEILYLDNESATTKVLEGREPYTYYRGADIHILGRIPEGYITYNGILDYGTDLVSKEVYEERDRERRKVIATWNITSDSNMTYEKVEKLVEGTFLDGSEQALIDSEDKYGISTLFTYAVACLESGYGQSNIARDKNNLYGMNAEDHDPYNRAFSYSSKTESIYDFIERIDKYYVDRGLVYLDIINKKYSSDDDWHNKVWEIMNSAADKINSN